MKETTGLDVAWSTRQSSTVIESGRFGTRTAWRDVLLSTYGIGDSAELVRIAKLGAGEDHDWRTVWSPGPFPSQSSSTC